MADPVVVALVVTAAVVGLLVGSFLNVVVHRVPRGLSVVRPASACPGCGGAIRRRHNVPVLGWLVLRGRCHDCAAPISARYPLVELGTAAAWAGLAWYLGPVWSLPAWLYLASIAIALALIDLDLHRLPNAIVLPAYPVGLVLVGGGALLDGRPGALLRGIVGAVVLGGAYLVLHLVRPDGMGFGDVKLSGVLGLYLGSVGWGALAVGGFSAFLVGGVVGVVGLVVRRAGRRTAIPFGPFMLLGAFLGLLTGEDLAAGYLRLVGL